MLPKTDSLPLYEPAHRFSQPSLELLLAIGHEHRYKKGDHIFRSGSPGENIYILETGRAKIYKLSDSGKEVILWFCLPGEMFGLSEISHGERRKVFAQACTESTVHCIARDDFTQFLRDNAEHALNVIDVLSRRLRVLGDRFMNLASDGVRSRVVKLILRMFDHAQDSGSGLDPQIIMTHQEIADMVGATRQTVTSILNDMKRDGVLRIEQRRIHIESHERLISMANRH